MSILVDKTLKSWSRAHRALWPDQTKLMLDYGTQIARLPGAVGRRCWEFHLRHRGRGESRAPDRCFGDLRAGTLGMEAATEAMRTGYLWLLITEGVPVHDGMKIRAMGREQRLLGYRPLCPGIITPGQTSLGMLPPSCAMPGVVGLHLGAGHSASR